MRVMKPYGIKVGDLKSREKDDISERKILNEISKIQNMEELSMANTMFALNIFKHIEKTNSAQNIFFSPWSISSTLAMVFLGARGNTEHQMAKVLQFNKVDGFDITTAIPENVSGFSFTQQKQKGNYPDAILQAQARDKVHSSFKSLNSVINTCSEDYLLESANKLFGEKSSRFKENYIQLCKKYYSAEPEAVDFLKCAEEARIKINSWVKTETKGEISNLLPEGSIDADTKMVLVNAVYFKGKWKSPFERKLNALYPFHVNSLESTPVQMMYLREKLNIGYIKDLKTQILELPYIGNISMFLLLPDEIDDASTGLELLESKINFDNFNKWISEDTMAENEVEVYIPQFKLEQHYELKPILRSMGMEDAFNKSQANFSAMSQRNDLFLSEVFHQATVDVNEEGTVAAGGTGAVMTGRTGHGGPQFVANHPFIFFIIQKTSKVICISSPKWETRFLMASLAVSINQFALEFSKKLAESVEGKNMFFSPWGISTSLAMVYLGTKGTTAAQMSQVLQLNRGRHYKSDPDSEKKRKMEFNIGKIEEIHSDFQTLAAEILKPGNSYILKTANRIYGEKTYPFHNKYLKDMQTYFGAEPQSVNFVGASGQIRTEINSWVKSQTGGKIPDLLPNDSVDSMTRMVLVNALYFKGTWEHQFSAQHTTERPFRINKTMSKPVQMMSMRKNLQVFHIEELQTIGLQLYYQNHDLSLLLLLPEDVDGLEQLERAITYEKLKEWTSADMMDTFEVQLYLPKFKLEESYDLKSVLSSMGMTDAFSQNKADFSNMSSDRNLFLSNVFHKTFVEINEEGTEAAAGTGSEVSLRIKTPSLEFNADHPFLFFIRHNKTNSILFYGRFCSP
ncbi:serpin B10 [Sigmodon hispidus]